jgi:RNA-directed DNA polymerase
LNTIPIHSALHGGPGTSQISAAKVHVAQPLLITLDLKNFFPSVRASQIQNALKTAGLPDETSEIICRLCTRKGVLPQGAPTSPVLARIVVTPALNRIEIALAKISPDCRITQYVDDLAMTGPVGLRRMIPLVAKIYEQCGFTINPEKTKKRKQSEEQEYLGLRVNKRVEVSDAFKAKLKSASELLPPKHKGLLGLAAWERKVRNSN